MGEAHMGFFVELLESVQRRTTEMMKGLRGRRMRSG